MGNCIIRRQGYDVRFYGHLDGSGASANEFMAPIAGFSPGYSLNFWTGLVTQYGGDGMTYGFANGDAGWGARLSGAAAWKASMVIHITSDMADRPSAPTSLPGTAF